MAPRSLSTKPARRRGFAADLAGEEHVEQDPQRIDDGTRRGRVGGEGARRVHDVPVEQPGQFAGGLADVGLGELPPAGGRGGVLPEFRFLHPDDLIRK